MRKFGLITAIAGPWHPWAGPIAPSARAFEPLAVAARHRAALRRRRPVSMGARNLGGAGDSCTESPRPHRNRHRADTGQLRAALRRAQGPQGQRHGGGRPVRARHAVGAARARHAGYCRLSAFGAHRQYLPRCGRKIEALDGCRAHQIGDRGGPGRRRASYGLDSVKPTRRCRNAGTRSEGEQSGRAGNRRLCRERAALGPLPTGARNRSRRNGHRLFGPRYRHQSPGRDQGHPACQRIQRHRTRRSESAVLS